MPLLRIVWSFIFALGVAITSIKFLGYGFDSFSWPQVTAPIWVPFVAGVAFNTISRSINGN